MCVAVVVESTTDITLEDLQKMERQNSDGGGVAWIAGGQVMFRKGLTALEIHELMPVLPRPFLMHFRIATRGAAVPELTHPFPIGPAALDGDLVGLADGVIIHNGTWSDYAKHVPPGIDPAKVSDTQIAAYVAGYDEKVLDHVSWSNAIMRVSPEGHADITMRGQWSEHGGNMFSNLHWRSTWTFGRGYTAASGWSNASDADWTFDEWAQWQDRHRGPVATHGRTGKLPPLGPRKSERKLAKRERRATRLRQKRIEAGVPLDLVDLMTQATKRGHEITPSDHEIAEYLMTGGDPALFDAAWEAQHGAVVPTLTDEEDQALSCTVGMPRRSGRQL